MAYATIRASKATPKKAIRYVLHSEDCTRYYGAVGELNAGISYGTVMMQTQHLYGKGHKEDERKYYHPKIAFAPQDRIENGGKLTPQMAFKFAQEVVKELWPGHEAYIGIHGAKGTTIHAHIILNSVNAETGEKIHMNNRDYHKFKDLVEKKCKDYELTAGDWRKSVEKKKNRERQSDKPVELTFTEEKLHAEGSRSWKDELRNIIDYAAENARSIDEFKGMIESKGVTLTRFSDTNISYKFGDHKAVRGDTLGGDYTRAAIQSAIEGNTFVPTDIEVQGGREVSTDVRRVCRKLAREGGIKRSVVDAECKRAPKATWEERKGYYAELQKAKNEYWTYFNHEKTRIKYEIDDTYKELKMARWAERQLNPYRYKRNIFSQIIALIYFSRHDSLKEIEERLDDLKYERQRLYGTLERYKRASAQAKESFNEGWTNDDYTSALVAFDKTVDKTGEVAYQEMLESQRKFQEKIQYLRELSQKQKAAEEAERRVQEELEHQEQKPGRKKNSLDETIEQAARRSSNAHHGNTNREWDVK